MSMGKDKKRVTFYMSERKYKELKSIALKKEVSVSVVVREAITNYLKNQRRKK